MSHSRRISSEHLVRKAREHARMEANSDSPIYLVPPQFFTPASKAAWLETYEQIRAGRLGGGAA